MAIYYAGFIPSESGFAVLFPDVPGCATEGATLEGAFAMSIEALSGHLEAMANDGDDIPPPSGKARAWEKLREQFAGLDMGPLPDGTELHPVPAPRMETRTRQVAVSLSQYKLDMIDRKAQAVGMTRSGFLVRAAEAYHV